MVLDNALYLRAETSGILAGAFAQTRATGNPDNMLPIDR